jgi:hypothetical protein
MPLLVLRIGAKNTAKMLRDLFWVLHRYLLPAVVFRALDPPPLLIMHSGNTLHYLRSLCRNERRDGPDCNRLIVF